MKQKLLISLFSILFSTVFAGSATWPVSFPLNDTAALTKAKGKNGILSNNISCFGLSNEASKADQSLPQADYKFNRYRFFKLQLEQDKVLIGKPKFVNSADLSGNRAQNACFNSVTFPKNSFANISVWDNGMARFVDFARVPLEESKNIYSLSLGKVIDPSDKKLKFNYLLYRDKMTRIMPYFVVNNNTNTDLQYTVISMPNSYSWSNSKKSWVSKCEGSESTNTCLVKSYTSIGAELPVPKNNGNLSLFKLYDKTGKELGTLDFDGIEADIRKNRMIVFQITQKGESAPLKEKYIIKRMAFANDNLRDIRGNDYNKWDVRWTAATKDSCKISYLYINYGVRACNDKERADQSFVTPQ